jgi:hypothetical protein
LLLDHTYRQQLHRQIFETLLLPYQYADHKLRQHARNQNPFQLYEIAMLLCHHHALMVILANTLGEVKLGQEGAALASTAKERACHNGGAVRLRRRQ